MTDELVPGRSIVTRRAIAEIVRAATLGSYGVTGFAALPLERLLGRLGAATPGLHVTLVDGGIQLDLDLTVAYGLPVAEVARQVDSAVRYRLRQALGREPARLTIRICGLVCPQGREPKASRPDEPAVAVSALADSGMDVA